MNQSTKILGPDKLERIEEFVADKPELAAHFESIKKVIFSADHCDEKQKIILNKAICDKLGQNYHYESLLIDWLCEYAAVELQPQFKDLESLFQGGYDKVFSIEVSIHVHIQKGHCKKEGLNLIDGKEAMES